MRRVVAITGLAVLAVLPIASVASAHPSDFRTLTIDLIFGGQGLETIDAAVVETAGPSYQPFPSVELRQAVALSVLQALGLADFDATIDPEVSQLYHGVGFAISFSEPLPGARSSFSFDTGDLQVIAADVNLDYLKVGVCATDSALFAQLRIDATRPGRKPVDTPAERRNCHIWELATEDSPVLFVVTPPALPMTGISFVGLLAAGGLLLIGAGLMTIRTSRGHHLVKTAKFN
jgi:hypothetical protein